MPEYMKKISAPIKEAIAALEKAGEIMEDSREYNEPNHVFHRNSVASYNAILTCLLKLDGMHE